MDGWMDGTSSGVVTVNGVRKKTFSSPVHDIMSFGHVVSPQVQKVLSRT